MEQVFNIKDLVKEIMKYLDLYSWMSFRLASKRFLIHNKDDVIDMYNKFKYADPLYEGWINQDGQWIYMLPSYLIKPTPKPSNIHCLAKTKKLTQCGNKALKGKYCCKLHSDKEINFEIKNKPLDYKICGCSACEGVTITDLETRVYEKNMTNKHCHYCACKDCVCPARQQTNDCESDPLTCHWDNPCRPRCTSCAKNYP